MSRTPLWTAAVLLLSALTLVPQPTHAGGEPRTHDGFFLRLASGPARFTNTLESGGDTQEFSRLGADLNIAVGGSIRPNLALHGTMFGWAAMDPELETTIGGVPFSGTANGYVAMSAVGGGVTWYAMPANVYLSGSLGYGKFTINPDNGATRESDNGLAFELTAGKEWWVGDSWGMGVAISYIHTSLPQPRIRLSGDPNDAPEDNWSGDSFGVRLTATLN